MLMILRPEELSRIEREHDGGVSAQQVVTLFQERGVRLSEATFRKYVQVGLLPRSRRVGRKGKHQGSSGLYPAAVFRRVAAIKSMMAAGMTLEEIRGSFLNVRGELDGLEQTLGRVIAELSRVLGSRAMSERERTRLSAELLRAREEASRLTRRFERLGSRLAVVTAPAEAKPNATPISLERP